MYDFHDLSPLDFEDLVRDLLQAELGLTMESFGPGAGQGIDCRFARDGQKIVVQAKHYIRSGRSKLLGDLKNENAKVVSLKPSRYIMATSVSMTPAWKQKIVEVMPDAPLEIPDVLGQEDLNNLLGKHPEIEKKHFKLWLGSAEVLERILHSGIYNRTETEMEIIKEMIPKFVQNASVQAAEDILSKAGTLIVAGHPGVGKTTLARMLVWLHASQGWKIFVVDDISEAFEISNPGEKRLIFFDDFLGQVRLSADHVRGIDQRLPPFLERVKANKNLRFILTTREYILSQAELLSRRLASRAMSANRYVLNVGVYTRAVRARILFNHLYFSGLSGAQLSEILDDDFYLEIIDHENYNPRLIELLTSDEYASLSGDSLKVAIRSILDNPDELWERPYRDHISSDGRALMLAMLLFQTVAPLDSLLRSFVRTADAIGLAIPDAQVQPRFASTLKELEGSVLVISDRHVRFSNPGVRDFLQVLVIKDNLIPSIVDHIETLIELKQCWTIFYQREPKPTPRPADASRWTDALERVEMDVSAISLDLFELALEMHNHFNDSRSIEICRRVAALIEEDGFDSSQIRDATYALENITLYALSFEDQEYFHRVLTCATVSILDNYIYELPFEDIEALDETLHTYGCDANIAKVAVHAALDAFIPEMDAEMEDFGSIDELDDFENRITKLIKKRRYVGESPTFDLNSKRERLLEDEIYQGDDEGYHRSIKKPAAPDEMTDNEVHSMFGNLLSSRS